ncbi:hypothetical protein IGB42_03324 [Andreprevotia sp. IGB-42]|uniref:type II secretion system protein GspK n=1 Tax=Andreprevotia sp. IGB-42 TaxID=2497473 RepID=UPI00135A6655|nr:type II secretion system protein GspK [Andreprevotia sp. IGB-42]KAF0812334.1 hypothetical protein IGB42_03324 [Andreprevotia sp. IGB-42]
MPSNARHHNEYARNRGYVLVMTIAALALLALVGAYVGQRISTALNLAVAEQDFARQERLARDKAARMIYLLATTRRSIIGLGGDEIAIRMDGRWYDAGDGMAISLQDGRGLINLRTAPRAWLEGLLTTYGVTGEANAVLLDTLEDYADNDDLHRMQGAEKDAYLRKKMLPPRNQPLESISELARVYNWAETKALWQSPDAISSHVVIGQNITGINPATATWRTLVATLSMSERDARNFIQSRESLDANGMELLASAYLNTNGVAFLQAHKAVLFPSTSVVMTIAAQGGKRAWRSTVTITPEAADHAWRVNDSQELMLAEPVAERDLPKLPNVSGFQVDLEKEMTQNPFTN